MRSHRPISAAAAGGPAIPTERFEVRNDRQIKAAAYVACRTCKADLNEKCRTLDGRPASVIHPKRRMDAFAIKDAMIVPVDIEADGRVACPSCGRRIALSPSGNRRGHQTRPGRLNGVTCLNANADTP